MKTFSIHTFGCKVNQAEEEKLRRFLISYGMEETGKGADVAFVNTCTVTHLADRKARQKIRQLCAVGGKVIVIGCGVRNPESFNSIEEKENIIYLNNRDDGFYKKLKQIIPCREQACLFPTNKRTRAFIKIQDGCNQFCSYCIVPYVREGIDSIPLSEVLEEIIMLERAGFKEIVITGVNIGLYGKDLMATIDLPCLIDMVCASTGINRIRLSSIEPNYVTDELIDVIKKHNKICPHFHIPLQHASNKILKLMNRQYTIEEYDALLNCLTSAIPKCAISTDILVGFPGEEDGDFEFLYNYVEKAPFSRLHVFKYSERPMTKAKDFKEKVPEIFKTKRSAALINLADKKLKKYNESFLGVTLDVLIEDSIHKSGYMQGYTSNYIQVLIQADERLKNQIVPAQLYKKDGILFGRMIDSV